ncbi:hypothetical protein BJ684DRAFT_22242 [Piptocephalis cylindrospora]|uniref:JAB1/MPN/MOV34 metalloenzyme domain-containing protein n=1 Tax=Piptocephalis cylindrospora TaxID=1907219 RepID=A0A4P9XXT2_9FUNG|nr:hypothetical protein BJ684DRAFT_22242 [Piptocephalis cylindrospora]|eukprot:RKP11215.1 hypothetical protein BJ684DRAFT_22242 [Piptocephalis cylindrospora]
MSADRSQNQDPPVNPVPPSGWTCSLHALAVLSISDHWTRYITRPEGLDRPLVGILLGKTVGEGHVEVWASFEVGVCSEGEVRVQESALNARRSQFYQVYPDWEAVGWYELGGGKDQEDNQKRGMEGMVRMNELKKQMHELLDDPLHLHLPLGLPIPDSGDTKTTSSGWTDLSERIRQSMWGYPDLRVLTERGDVSAGKQEASEGRVKAQPVEVKMVMSGVEKIAVDDVMMRAHPARRVKEADGPRGSGKEEEETESAVVEGLKQQKSALEALGRNIRLLASFVEDIHFRQDGGSSEVSGKEAALLWDIASIAHLDPPLPSSLSPTSPLCVCDTNMGALSPSRSFPNCITSSRKGGENETRSWSSEPSS